VGGTFRRCVLAACVCSLVLCVSTTARAETRRVAAGANLQTVLDAAQPGDLILLSPGATYTGNFVLRRKTGSTFITLQTEISETGALGPGKRITPAAAAPLAKLQSPNSAPALRTEAYAHHWRIQLVRFGPNSKGYGEVIQLGDGSAVQNTLAMVPYAFAIDRVYIYGDPLLGQKRGIALNARDVTITNSYISDIKAIGQDTQAIAGWNGPGPFLIENNYLEAAGENFLLGSPPEIPNLVPAGLTFRRNHVARPPSWKDPIVPPPASVSLDLLGGSALAPGTITYYVTARRPAGQTSYAESSPVTRAIALSTSNTVRVRWPSVANATEYRVYRQSAAGTVYFTTTSTEFVDAGGAGTAAAAPDLGTRWMVKNIFELKNARNVVVESNLFEYNWLYGQAGYAIVFTVRNSSGACTWCTIENVEFRNNVVRHVAGGINILGYDSPEISQQGRNFKIVNNLFYDVDAERWDGPGIFLLIGDEPRDIVVDHNTVDHTGASLVSVYGGTPENRREVYGFTYTNNAARHGKYGVFGAGSSPGLLTIQTYFPDGVFKRNLFSGGSASKYPADNFFTSPFETQFVNYAGGDFRLASTSPLINAATDGTNVGVDIAKLATALAAASGTTPETTDPPAAPKALRFSGGQ
jgi:hypothetical protein